jgi:hypothetical protein
MISRTLRRAIATVVALVFSCFLAEAAIAQQSSISAWDAAEFRSWSFVPYWTSHSQIDSFATDRVYDHLSDILYFSGVMPRADGSLSTSSNNATDLAKLKSHQAQFGFRYHMSMFDTSGGSVETVWNSITSNPTTRATFVNNVKNLLTANNMTGFNLDWERPNTVTEWANYTQLAKDMQAAFPESWEVSVDDYGFASSLWDDTPVFDARTYDQIGMMGYHYPANNGTSLDQQSFADGKKALTGQGAEKAFQDSQIIIGMGTWGDDGRPSDSKTSSPPTQTCRPTPVPSPARSMASLALGTSSADTKSATTCSWPSIAAWPASCGGRFITNPPTK